MSEDAIVFSLEKNEIVFFNITKSTWETVQRKFAAGLWDLPFELKWLAAQKLTTLLARTIFVRRYLWIFASFSVFSD